MRNLSLSRQHGTYLWLVCLTGICLLSIAPSFNPPGETDLILHFVCYFLISFIPLMHFKRRDLAFMAAGAAPTLGLFLEYVQNHISSRNFSTEDMLANNLGAAAGILFGIVLRLVNKSRRINGE